MDIDVIIWSNCESTSDDAIIIRSSIAEQRPWLHGVSANRHAMTRSLYSERLVNSVHLPGLVADDCFLKYSTLIN